MVNLITVVLPAVSAIIALLLSIGGMFVIRQGYSKAVGEIQEKVIAAQKSQIGTLEAQLEIIQKESARLKGVIETITQALEPEGIALTVVGEMVTLEKEGRSSSIRRRPAPKKPTV